MNVSTFVHVTTGLATLWHGATTVRTIGRCVVYRIGCVRKAPLGTYTIIARAAPFANDTRLSIRAHRDLDAPQLRMVW